MKKTWNVILKLIIAVASAVAGVIGGPFCNTSLSYSVILDLSSVNNIIYDIG